MNNRGMYFTSLGAVLGKDLAAEWRSRELISGMLVFAILILFIFNFALELDPHTSAGLSSGILWVTLIFSGTTGLNRSMISEKDRGSLDGLLLAPVDRSAIFFGKVLANWIFMILTAAVLLPLYGLLFSVNLLNFGLISIIVIGTAGYALTGTLLAALALPSRTHDLLLPVLLFPVIVPLLLACVKASSGFLQGYSCAELQPWLALLIAYDIIFLVLGWFFFEPLMEE
ncbi:MAG: ABC transporter permease [Leptolinea sp.]|jgi:heme exporter protein B|nr:ABC transporter permease [Leptolinea sp.]